MKQVSIYESPTRKKVQHEKSARRRMRNKEKLQPKKSATAKK